jgi:hypothetical protein
VIAQENNAEFTYNFHLHQRYPAFPPSPMACRVLHLPQCSAVGLVQAVMQSQVLCIVHWQGQCWGSQAASEDWEEVVRYSSTVFEQYSLDEPCAPSRAELKKPWCCRIAAVEENLIVKLNYFRDGVVYAVARFGTRGTFLACFDKAEEEPICLLTFYSAVAKLA